MSRTLPLIPTMANVLFPGSTMTRTFAKRPAVLALEAAAGGIEPDLILALRRYPEAECTRLEHVHEVGTRASVRRMETPRSGLRVVLQGIERVRIIAVEEMDGQLTATYEPWPLDEKLTTDGWRAYHQLHDAIAASMGGGRPAENARRFFEFSRPVQTAWEVADLICPEVEDAQALLEEPGVEDVFRLLMQILAADEVRVDTHSSFGRPRKTDRSRARQQSLMQQMYLLHREMGEAFPTFGLREELDRQVRDAPMPEAARETALGELSRLRTVAVATGDFKRRIDRVKFILALPWGVVSPEPPDLDDTRIRLNSEHFGHDETKRRALDYLAAARRNPGTH